MGYAAGLEYCTMQLSVKLQISCTSSQGFFGNACCTAAAMVASPSSMIYASSGLQTRFVSVYPTGML